MKCLFLYPLYSGQDTHTDTHTRMLGNPRSAQSQLLKTNIIRIILKYGFFSNENCLPGILHVQL